MGAQRLTSARVFLSQRLKFWTYDMPKWFSHEILLLDRLTIIGLKIPNSCFGLYVYFIMAIILMSEKYIFLSHFFQGLKDLVSEQMYCNYSGAYLTSDSEMTA